MFSMTVTLTVAVEESLKQEDITPAFELKMHGTGFPSHVRKNKTRKHILLKQKSTMCFLFFVFRGVFWQKADVLGGTGNPSPTNAFIRILGVQ